MKIKLPSVQILLLAILFTILALTVLTQANPGTELPNRDYGFYAYIGKQIAKGELPYQDVWESKPPAIFYLNAFALRLGRGLRWGIWFVEFVFLFSAIASSFYLFKKLWGMIPALFGVIAWLWGMDLTLQGGNFTEEYPLTFHFFTLIILLYLIQNPKQRLLNLGLGLTLSISFLFRPNNAIVEVVTILVFGASLLWKREWRAFFTAFFWVALGGVVPLAITSAYFAYHGLFQAMLEASILYNLTYSSTELTSTSPLQAGFEILNISAWIGLIGYVLLYVRIKEILKSPDLLFFIVLLVGAPTTVYLSDPAKRNYGHYFMNWLPLMGALSAFAFYTFQEKLLSRKTIQQTTEDGKLPITPSLFLIVITLAVFFMTGRGTTYYEALNRFFNSTDREIRTPISIYVENHTNPGEYVLFWAVEPRENFMSKRPAPHSTLFYPLLVKSDISDKLNEDFLEDLQRNKPVLIVDLISIDRHSLDPNIRQVQDPTGLAWWYPPENLQEFYKFVEDHYYLEAVIKGKTVYRLNGTAAP